MITDKQKELFKKLYGVEPPKSFKITKNTGVFSNKRFVIHVEYSEQINDAIAFVDAVMYNSVMHNPIHIPIDIRCNDSENHIFDSIKSVGCKVEDTKPTVQKDEPVWCEVAGMNPMGDIINALYSDDDPNKPVTIPKKEHKNFVTGLIGAAFKRTGVGVEMSLGWGVSGKNTTCDIIHKGEKYSADAKKHPRDIDNEYIGKSLSFKRAYAALVDGINVVHRQDAVGHAPRGIKKGAWGVVLIEGYPHICKAGEDIKRMDSIAGGEDGCVFSTECAVNHHSNYTLRVKIQKEEIKQRFRVVEDTIKAIEHLMKHGCSRIASCLDCPAHRNLKNNPSMCRLLRKIPKTIEVVNGCYNCKHEGCNEICSTFELGKTKLTQYRKISNWEPKQ